MQSAMVVGCSMSVLAFENEFRGACFGDARLSARQVALGSKLAAQPGAGLPECVGRDSQLECSYRFLSNRRVNPQSILQPHILQTAMRIPTAGQAGDVLAVHDTTELEFGGERQGLGPLSSGSRRGFFLHLSLAVACSGDRRHALGVLAQRTWVRPTVAKPRRRRRLNGQASRKRPERESRRWPEQIQQVEKEQAPGVSLIHVADRESDAFEVLEAVQGLKYVLRANHDRRVFHDEEPLHLRQVCEQVTAVVGITVDVSARKARQQPGAAKTHPQRDARTAKVHVRGFSVQIREPYKRSGKQLQLNVVHAREVDAPAGATPIDWLLYTSEPIDTPEQLLRVLDLYRARWTIEEFFKALKTGCQVQTLQLETYEALRNAVALHLPIAWQLLALRSLGRIHPHAPAQQVLTASQLAVLRVASPRPLSAECTVAQAMIAVAALGGYLASKAKGPPGWLTLGKGMRHLLDMELGWLAARTAGHTPEDPLEH